MKLCLMPLPAVRLKELILHKATVQVEIALGLGHNDYNSFSVAPIYTRDCTLGGRPHAKPVVL
jgi:hypothetical protein